MSEVYSSRKVVPAALSVFHRCSYLLKQEKAWKITTRQTRKNSGTVPQTN